MQHIKEQGGTAPAEHSKALCHKRLPQAPGKGKAQGAAAPGRGGLEWLGGAAGQIQAQGEKIEKMVQGRKQSKEAVEGKPVRRLVVGIQEHVLCFLEP